MEIRRIKSIEKVYPNDFSFIAIYNNNQKVLINLKEKVLKAKMSHNEWLGALADPDFFSKITIEAPGNPTWPNDVDFCSDALYLEFSNVVN